MKHLKLNKLIDLKQYNMSELKVNKISPRSGTDVTLGDSGDTITIPSGATLTNSGTATGFGKVLQVVTATDSTQRTTTSATFVTGSNTLSATITPSSASNKIFVVVTTAGGQNTGNRSAKYDLRRDSTSIAELNCNDTADILYYPIVISNLDSPNTTSAITYQLFFRTDGVGTVAINYAGTKGSITVFEIEG
jgi:hypothetical protein